ncbi:MAG TPA: Gfo/Idh/MocA family oxidoreductase [Anaerolineae bacterium]|nr:Gfo/Idh/MocA family oxidoreductase [Anaerolineae bacterium]HQI84363.1 Gfo/Idh/MocA family oxidoreductase [Anaerolineae bacterium]
MNSPTINLAFIGSGHWARKHHFPALDYLRTHASGRFDLHLRGIYSLDQAGAADVAAQYGFARVYDSLDALLADRAINAAAVAVPPEAVAGVLEQVATLRVPVFSEKPPGISAAQAQRLSEIITVPNVLAFNRRYAPLNNIFKDVVAQMADIYFVEGHFFRHHRLDDMFIIGTGIHWINLMTYLFGDIAHVSVDRFRNPQNETWVRIAQVVFAGGFKGALKFFPCSGSQVERIEVHSNTQSAYLDGPLGDNPGAIVIEAANERRVIQPEALATAPEIVRIGIVGEYEEFFTLVCDGTPSRSIFQNAVNAMRVAEAIEYGWGF